MDMEAGEKEERKSKGRSKQLSRKLLAIGNSALGAKRVGPALRTFGPAGEGRSGTG